MGTKRLLSYLIQERISTLSMSSVISLLKDKPLQVYWWTKRKGSKTCSIFVQLMSFSIAHLRYPWKDKESKFRTPSSRRFRPKNKMNFWIRFFRCTRAKANQWFQWFRSNQDGHRKKAWTVKFYPSCTSSLVRPRYLKLRSSAQLISSLNHAL